MCKFNRPLVTYVKYNVVHITAFRQTRYAFLNSEFDFDVCAFAHSKGAVLKSESYLASRPETKELNKCHNRLVHNSAVFELRI